jgi:prepilin-type N-terminal cleavage/methylation domain-containing protein/prepilin-type processing-associated H-X9-DG protein
MKHGHKAADTRKAFTLVELLMVICIIGLLLALFIPTMLMVKDRLMRLKCSTNLVKCYKVMAQYAANNSGWLPPSFVSAKQHTFISNIQSSGESHTQHTELGDSNNPPNLTLYNELKRYGACADIFICPAYEGYGDANDAYWRTWTVKPFSENVSGVGTAYELSTAGYLFFDGYLPGSTTNRRLVNLGGGDGLGGCQFSDLRTWAISNDARFNPPLAADMLIWFDAGKGDGEAPEDGDEFAGFYHYSSNDGMENPAGGTKPGGGGNTVFLDGSVYWYDWDDLVGGIKTIVPATGYGEQPAVDWGRRSTSSSTLGAFFCGLRASAQL